MASLNVLVKLLPTSPFRLSRCFFIGVHRFLSASCFYFHLLNFLLAVSISFCNLGFIGCHVFEIRSGHIHFQGQYCLYPFPFVSSIFLVVFFALVVFVFNAFLVIIFLHPLRDFSLTRESNSLLDYWRVRLLSLEPRLFLYFVLTVPLYLSGCNSLVSAFPSYGSREWFIRWLRFSRQPY